MAEVLATIAFLAALVVALAAVGSFLARAERRHHREQDTDHDL